MVIARQVNFRCDEFYIDGILPIATMVFGVAVAQSDVFSCVIVRSRDAEQNFLRMAWAKSFCGRQKEDKSQFTYLKEIDFREINFCVD